MTPDGVPESLRELCDYIVEHMDSIFVLSDPTEAHPERSWRLSELPGRLAIEKALGFVKKGRVPMRVRTEAEVAEREGEPGGKA